MTVIIRVSVILSVCLLFGQLVVAGSDQSGEGLVLRLVVPRTSVRPGTDSLPIELFLVNSGPTDIRLDREWQHERTDYEAIIYVHDRFSVPMMGGIFSDPIGGITEPIHWITLPPGKAQRKCLVTDFTSGLKSEGFYKVRILYTVTVRDERGAIRKLKLQSNWGIFAVEQDDEAGE